MKQSITVLGVEAEGIRGVRLEEDGEQWVVADSGFWTTAHDEAEASDAEDQDGQEKVSEENTADDRYAATVEAIKAAAKQFDTREVVLSMPLASLLVRVSHAPLAEQDKLAETAGVELGKVSPFPDESPTIGMETVAETDSELTVVLAALPSVVAAEIGDALDEAKVRVTRTDVTALGWLRTLWPKVLGNGDAGTLRRVVLMDLDDGWDIVVLDGGVPSLLRGLGRISDVSELEREVMLSVLRAGAGGEVGEVVVFSKTEVDGAIVERLKQFGPVRVEQTEAADGGIEGVARRTQEGASLDVTPTDWVELRTEARFKKKLMLFLSAAAAGWLLVMGVLFGVPFVYGQMTEHQKTLSKRHATAYKEVKEMRDKVKLVQQYSDHARGSLEMLKAVSDRMPEGIVLTSFSYKRGERLSIVGEAAQPTDVYEFKNALTDAVTEDEQRLFATVNLTGPTQSRGVHKFSIEGLFESEEEHK